GIDLSTQTLADQVGHVTFAVKPLFDLIETHVFEAERLHGDDTTIPILAKGHCTTGRIWVYVRDDQPFAGPAPPAAVFYASSDRRGEHPQEHLANFSGILQADCYNGFSPLFDRTRKQMPATPAFCFAHARRKFFELADVARNARRGKGAKPISPVALEAVKRIDALFAIEREINGFSAAERFAVRQEKSKPLLGEMEKWLRAVRADLSRSSPVAGPIDYMLSRWADFARYADDGRICMTNNAAERALRGVATRVSLRTPYSSICKHWKRVLIDRATRAPLSGDRGFYRVGRKVRRPDLIRRAWNDLYGGKDIGLDKAANGMVRYAKRSGSLQHGQPFATFLSR